LASSKEFDNALSIIGDFTALLVTSSEMPGASCVTSVGRKFVSSSDKEQSRPVLNFDLPPSLDVSRGSVEWRIPAGVSKVGHAMKNAEFVRAWKQTIENVLSQGDVFASAKVSDDGPEDLLLHWEGESNYWADIMALLKSPAYRAVLLTCRADRSLNRQWKNAVAKLSQRFACAYDASKFLKVLQPSFAKLDIKCPINFAPDVLSQLINAAHASVSICRYNQNSQILTTFFARVSNRLIDICKFNLQGEQFWNMLQQNAFETNSKLRKCIFLLDEYPRIFKLAQQESASSDSSQPAASVDRSIIFARTKVLSERLKKLLDVTDALQQFDNAISAGIHGLSATVDPFKIKFKSFTATITSPLNLSGEYLRLPICDALTLSYRYCFV
jgi:hypothetical protein